AETGLEKGTVLTTGFASNLNGTSNTSDEITGVNNTAGDPGLDAMIPGYSTFDAAVLSFDFIPSYLRETHWNSVIYSARKNITNTLTRITMTFSVSSSTVSITRLFRKQTLRFQSAA
ncbi:MAG: hypothetical protein GY749_31960, partial [Desulfobacteraceae bacterium]|nr:hypothetical protein [Desulfobacteraceae bacterium]